MRTNKLVAVNLPRLGPGRHNDGGGLYLSVRPDGARRWVLLYRAPRTKRPREMGLGGHAVSLAAARDRARAVREQLAAGIDPIDAKHEAVATERTAADTVVTFGSFAEEFLGTLNFSNAKHRAQWRLSLIEHAADLRDVPLRDITAKHVIDVLTPVFERTRETATRTRGRIEKLLGVATVYGHREGPNPARWTDHLVHVFGNRGQRVNRHESHWAAMPYRDVPKFMVALRQRGSISAMALEFAILTAARTGEVLGATWGEIDLESNVWTIPASRMKAKREHRIPLSARAAEILKAMHRSDAAADDAVFVGYAGRMSQMTLLQQLRGLQPGFTVHGFRSSFSDWVGDESGFDSETREFALAHVKGDKAEAAYRRATAFDKRTKLMDAWAKYLAG